MASGDDGTYFLAAFTGQVKSVHFPGGNEDDEIFFRYDIVGGPDWELICGTDGGLSQTATRGSYSEDIVFNMPIDASFKTNSPSGWPQIVISVYGVNSWGVEAARGYGRIHLPTTAGHREFSIPLVAPRPATALAEFAAWFSGRRPELINPKVLAEGSDTYLLRTRSHGRVLVNINLVSKGLRTIGYDNVPEIQH